MANIYCRIKCFIICNSMSKCFIVLFPACSCFLFRLLLFEEATIRGFSVIKRIFIFTFTRNRVTATAAAAATTTTVSTVAIQELLVVTKDVQKKLNYLISRMGEREETFPPPADSLEELSILAAHDKLVRNSFMSINIPN